MNIHQCDICKKKVELDSTVRAGIGFLRQKDFCEKCGKPILDFLKKNKLIDDKKKK